MRIELKKKKIKLGFWRSSIYLLTQKSTSSWPYLVKALEIASLATQSGKKLEKRPPYSRSRKCHLILKKSTVITVSNMSQQWTCQFFSNWHVDSSDISVAEFSIFLLKNMWARKCRNLLGEFRNFSAKFFGGFNSKISIHNHVCNELLRLSWKFEAKISKDVRDKSVFNFFDRLLKNWRVNCSHMLDTVKFWGPGRWFFLKRNTAKSMQIFHKYINLGRW